VNDEPPGAADSAGGTFDAAQPDKSDVLAAPTVNPSISVRLGPLADGPMRNDVAEQLAFEVDALDVVDMPLVRFIDTLTDLSGAPITLNPVALELSGNSPQGTVSISAKNAALGELLQDALRKSRLTFVENNGHVILALPDAERRSSREFDFGDLADAGAADAAGVAKLIQTFVSPQSWDADGGGGSIEALGYKLRIEQRKAAHHEMLLFCERLRLARGLARKSKYPAELLSIDSPYAKINARLSQETTFTFLPWTRLAEVFRHWQESSGITILVDWHRMADLELGPSTPLACSAIDRTWEEVLDESLEPLGLAWWAVDGATIQITSREALDEIHRIEFYQIPKPVRDQFSSGDALLETLQGELREEVGAEVTTSEQLHMQLDKPSRRLIVRGTPAVHRYLAKRIGSAASQ
jgi:hypothetical protein